MRRESLSQQPFVREGGQALLDLAKGRHREPERDGEDFAHRGDIMLSVAKGEDNRGGGVEVMHSVGQGLVDDETVLHLVDVESVDQRREGCGHTRSSWNWLALITASTNAASRAPAAADPSRRGHDGAAVREGLEKLDPSAPAGGHGHDCHMRAFVVPPDRVGRAGVLYPA